MEDIKLNSIKQGKRLQEARTLTLLSRRAFSKKYGFNISSFQAWEEGRYKKGLNIKIVTEITAALLNENIDCSPQWLLEGKGEPPRRHTRRTHHTIKGDSNSLIKEAEYYKKIRENNNSLVQAIKKNNTIRARELINQGADLYRLSKRELYLYSLQENTCLHIAAQYNSSMICKIFLELGLNPNIRNRYNDTALHFAAYEGNTNVINLLVKAGANIEASNNEGTTPLMWAAINGRLNSCELLLTLGASVNNTDYIGNTAIHWAAFDGQIQAIEELYKNGANVNIKNYENKTPTDIAIRNGHKKTVIALLGMTG